MTVNGVRHALELTLQAKPDIRETIAQGLKNDAETVLPLPLPLSLFSSPPTLAGEGRGEGPCSHAVIPDVSHTVIPDISHTVIPDVINRESKARGRGLAPGGSNNHRPLKMDMTGVRTGITGRTG